MGLFDFIFRPKEADRLKDEPMKYFKTLTAYRPAWRTWNGRVYENELVQAAIDARARHISKLSVVTQGAGKPLLQNALKHGPNEWQTWSQFLYRASVVLDLHGTCTIVPVKDKDLNTTGYFVALPDHCELVTFKNVPYLRYRFATGDVGAVPAAECAILTSHQYKSDFFGTAPKLDGTMKLIGIQEQAIEESAKNAATYRFMATLSNFSTDEDLANERKRFSANNFSAEAEAGGMLLFPNKYSNIQQLKAESYAMDADQQALIQTNVFNYFGVSEAILQNKASTQELDAFFNGCIEPFSIQFSDTMTKAAFTIRERSNGSKILATANRLQYMSVAEKVSMAQQLGDRGAMTIDEIRELFNYPPLPDGLGDRAPIRGEYYFVGDEKEDSSNE